MAIIGTLPNIIVAGQPVSAAPVMADFNYIVSQVNANAQPLGSGGEWITESNPVAFVSATSFKVTGVNVTATYSVGRRVRVAHNGGATTSYATITASAFGTDTTVTVVVDGAVALVSTVTAVAYSILSDANLAQPAPQVAALYSIAISQNLTSATNYAFGDAPFPISSKVDLFSEFSAAGLFTAKYSGYYLATMMWRMAKNGATVTVDPSINLTNLAGGTTGYFDPIVVGVFSALIPSSIMQCSGIIYIPAAGTLKPAFVGPTFTGGPCLAVTASFSLTRLRSA
jgi:hypothetical protein